MSWACGTGYRNQLTQINIRQLFVIVDTAGWPSTATQAVKDSALAHFKEDLEGAALNWADNRAKLKKFAAIGKELAEFEEALNDGSGITPEPDNSAPVKSKKA